MAANAFVSFIAFLALGQASDVKGAYDGDFLIQGFPVCHAQLLYAQHAEKNASQQTVKNFAKSVHEDHKQIHKDFGKAAEDRKIGVVAGLEKSTKEHLAELGRLKGVDYDREFLRLTVDGHKRLIELFDAQAKSGQDNELKTLASRTVTKLRTHQTDAKRLMTETK